MRLGVAAAVVDGSVVPGDVELEAGTVAAVGLPGHGSGVAIPGLVDLQVNGVGDVDFATADASGFRRAAAALREAGTTAFLATFVTAPEEALAEALARLPDEDAILGAHLEGPFLSPARLGAHRPEARCDPDPALLSRLLDAGPVTHVTLAPELSGALELVDLLVGRGVTAALGHSDATAEEAVAAFDRGARTVTHLFNAMRPLGHRDPGIAGAALAREDVTVQLIGDGVHLADETLLLAFHAARRRAALVSDASGPTLGGTPLAGGDGAPRRPDGTLAGSRATLLDGVRRLHGLGVPLAEAVAAATAVPAAITGRPDLGSLRPGSRGPVLVLDDELELVRVV